MDGSREYDLCIRQQPKQARMCGVGADRRPIDPPPIVQLRVIDKARKNLPSPSPSPPPTQHHQQPASHPHAQQHPHEPSVPLDTSMLTPAGFGTGPFLQNPYYFMFASLAKPDDDTELHWMKDGKTRCTTGSVVSSLYHLKDSENDNRDAGFFVFPDLSVRQEGSYRLKLSLFEVVGSNVYHCKSIFSTPFYVYTAKKFPGMEESTALSCSLADQGIKIRIRKDIRQRKPRSSTTNFPITNGQPLGPGVPIQDDESDRESEVRHDDHNDTTNNHNSLSNITTSKPLNGRKRHEREPEKDRERDLKRPRVDGDEGEPAPNPPPSTGEWGIDTPLAPGAPSGPYDHHTRSTASVPPPPPSAPGYPLPPPPQHPTYDQPPPQHHAPVPAHHPPQHQPPHHYPAPPPQSVHPQHHPQHPPPPPYPAQYPSSWPPPQHPQHPPPPPHQYDHYQQHYTQYPPPRYASAAYDPYAPPPPQPQSVPTYPSAAGYYAQYGRPGEPYGQYPPPGPPPPAPGPEAPNSSNRNPPVYGQYQPPPPQQPPPPPAQQPPTTTENSNYAPPTPSASSSTGGRTSTGPAPPAPQPQPQPQPGAGAASMYYQSHAQAAPRYGTPPPGAYPPAPYHPHPPPPPPTHHASPPGHYAPYQHPSHPPPPHQGTWSAPNYPAPAPGVYPGQSQNQNGTWENGAASTGHGNVSATTRETSAAPPPVATTAPSGPGLQLAPLRGPDNSRGDRPADARTDLKDDRERRKGEREPWNMRGHGVGGGAPPTGALGSMNRSDRSRKLSIGMLTGTAGTGTLLTGTAGTEE